MDDNQQIQDLLRRIDTLNRQQSLLQDTIDVLKNDVHVLALKVNNADKNGPQIAAEAPHELAFSVDNLGNNLDSNVLPITVDEVVDAPVVIVENKVEVGKNETETAKNEAEVAKNETGTIKKQEAFESVKAPQYPPPFEVTKSLEAFIGENLASKVGIIITVLGIAIGVKYAIDHDLISYWGRIILGYLAGCGLLEVAFKLRQKDEKYENLSNIILGGGFASVFFVTYAAYAFYGLMPQTVAFGLMVLITVATVVAALKYDQQIIAIGGLLGAYAIPFLLSTGEDKPITLFTYVLIINIGILYVSFKRDWRILYYLAFGITWCLFLSWLNTTNGYARTGIALTYATLFFTLFYTLFLAYKFIRNEASSVAQTFILVINSILFYGVGYATLNSNELGTHYLGVFTLFNALVHLIISKVIYERDLADRKLFDLLSAFGILFVTLTIPVQFNGTWVTTLWAVEMAFLFWFGRTKNLPTYEKATYPVWILTSLSVVHDWGTGGYFNESLWLRPNYISPVFNIYFLTTLIILAAFVFILKMHLDKKNDVDAKEDKLDLLDILSYFIVLFVTVAVAVEFNGVAVTILWAVEMALFFWLGRTKNFPAFEKSTYVLWVLTTCSLVNDWFDGRYLNYMHFNEASRIPSVLNIYCLITVVVIAAFTFTRFVHSDEKYRINRPNLEDNKVFDGILLTALVGLTYALFFNEINNFFSWKYDNLLINQGITDNNILRFRTVWLINYTVLFTTILNVLNLRKYKNSDYAAIAGVFGILSLAAFLTGGLYILGELKNAYLYHEQARYFPRGIGGGLLLRYVSYALVAVLIYVLRETKNAFFAGEKNLLEAFDIMVSVTLLWVLSSEMVHWLELSGFTQTYKWAISVLFGVFALGLIVYGINTHKKHLRFLAIGLFILTLIKVFAFDLMGLDTIHKTIVMISLGVLLLIVSFLYTKFKDVLFTDEV